MEYQYEVPLDEFHLSHPSDALTSYDTPFWDYMGAVKDDTWNNATALGTFARRQEAQSTFTNADELFGGDTESVSIDLDAVEWETPMQPEEQKQWIKQNGMEGKIEPYFVQGTNGTPDAGYTKETLEMLKSYNKEDEENAFLRQNASDWYAPFGVAMMMGTSMLDIPGMVMTMGAPVLGQTRALNMLRMAEGVSGRFGVRALQGAISGAGAMAILEPTIVSNRLMWNSEWSPYESVLNIGMGAIIGAGLHSAFGTIGERIRNGRGERQPWQVLTPDAESERLRTNFRENLKETAKKAEMELGGGKVRINSGITDSVADAVSGQFDVIARTVAYDLNKPLAEVYGTLAPSFNIRDTRFTKAIERLARGENIPIEKIEALIAKEAEKPLEVVVDELGKTAINLFRGTDSEAIQRAFFYGYRRMMEQIAKRPEARPSAKLAYSQMEQFVGATPGAKWTAEQNRRFGDAAMLFFHNRKAVPAGMQEAFEGMNQFMREMKLQAENTGVPIPRSIDDRLDTLQSSIEDRDTLFSERMTELVTDRDMEPRETGIQHIEGLTDKAEGGTEIERLQRETQNMERETEHSDLVSEDIREKLRANGYDEDIIRAMVDPELEAEAVRAEQKAMDYQKLMAEDDLHNVVECFIRQSIGG